MLLLAFACVGGNGDRFVDKVTNNIKCEKTSRQGMSLKETIYW
jgi:hypothetical protein